VLSYLLQYKRQTTLKLIVNGQCKRTISVIVLGSLISFMQAGWTWSRFANSSRTSELLESFDIHYPLPFVVFCVQLKCVLYFSNIIATLITLLQQYARTPYECNSVMRVLNSDNRGVLGCPCKLFEKNISWQLLRDLLFPLNSVRKAKMTVTMYFSTLVDCSPRNTSFFNDEDSCMGPFSSSNLKSKGLRS
jgi:hypothetical protein